MEKLFLAVLNLSITASYLIAAVIAARLLLRKAPKSIVCFLWILVGIRLVCPFSIESTLSLLPREIVLDGGLSFSWQQGADLDKDNFNESGKQEGSQNQDMANTGEDNPNSLDQNESSQNSLYGNHSDLNSSDQNHSDQNHSDQSSLDQGSLNQGNLNQDRSNQNGLNADGLNQDSANSNHLSQDRLIGGEFSQEQIGRTVMNRIYYFASYVWLIGMGAMLVYFVISWRRVQNKVRTAVPMELEGIKYYQCDSVSSPFLFGVVNPRIYVPSRIAQQELLYVLRHEMAHRQRRDYLIKPISYLLLMVYWINPIVWAAYILLCRDIELACDEQVVKKLGIDCKKAYSQALLTYSISRSTIAACPVSFGEIGVKQRVKNILNYKKPTFWVILAAIAAGIVITVCFMTKPKTRDLAADDIRNEAENEINSDNSETASDPEITEMVDIRESEVFWLSMPRELADLLSFEVPSKFELLVKSADKQHLIGTMCVMLAKDVENTFNEDEYYRIGTYGANSALANSGSTGYDVVPIGGLDTPDEVMRSDEFDTPDGVVRPNEFDVPDGIIRPDETDAMNTESGGVQQVPNADGTHQPQKLPNSDGGFTAGVIGEINLNSNHENSGDMAYEFCYIFIPAEQTEWETEKAAELQELQDKVISLLDSVTITEVRQLTENDLTDDVTAEYKITESQKAAFEERLQELEAQIAAVNQQIQAFSTNEQISADTKEQIVKTTNDVRVRETDSEQASVIGMFPPGNELIRIQELDNGWSKIIFNGQEGFIKSEYLEIVADNDDEIQQKITRAHLMTLLVSSKTQLEMEKELVTNQLELYEQQNSSENIHTNVQETGKETTAKVHENYHYVEQWAEAFCSEKPYAHFKTKANPWPWDWNWESTETGYKNYRIVSVTDDTATVLYYAWNEEPHVAVWCDTMTYEIRDGAFEVIQSAFGFGEEIDSARKFYQYYPNGNISYTFMDYANANQLGEQLNTTAMLSSTRKYLPLLEPETAAVYLLNILDNPKKVATEKKRSDDGESVIVTLRFIEDGSTASVKMVQPYGTNGIWVPQTDETAVVPAEYACDVDIVLQESHIASKRKEDAKLLENYFPDHHERQKELVQTVDLDGDGINEEITMTDLMYNGGDGGFAISVKRKGVEIPMPQIYKDDRFPYFIKYDTSKAMDGKDVVLEVYAGHNAICSLTSDALYELYLQKGQIDDYKRYINSKDTKQTQNEVGSIIYTVDAKENINGDAVSGFTVQTIDGKPTLILKTYLSGLLGHADTLGYAITYMTLNENDIWEVRHHFLLEGD